MFPRNRVDVLYRLLCLIVFIITILFIDSSLTVIIISISFYLLTISERRIENIFLYVITIVAFIMCLVLDHYLLLRLVTVIDFIHYYLNVDTVISEDESLEITRDEHYIRFKKEERKIDNNNKLCTIFVLVHMIILLVAIVVG